MRKERKIPYQTHSTRPSIDKDPIETIMGIKELASKLVVASAAHFVKLSTGVSMPDKKDWEINMHLSGDIFFWV
jgi:hypothetical protein